MYELIRQWMRQVSSNWSSSMVGDTPLIDLNYDGKAANLRDDKSELTTILPADVLLGNLPNLQDIMNTKAVILQSKLDTFSGIWYHITKG